MTQGIWGWSYVLFGSVLVGFGGLLATLGWNKIQSYDQWRNAITGVVREVELNDEMIKEAADLVKRWPQRSDSDHFSYESFHDTHLAAIVTSGLIDSKHANDREILASLEQYRRAISQFNAALRIVARHNPGIFIDIDLLHVKDVSNWPEKIEDAFAQQFRNLVRAHSQALQLLQKSYPWTEAKTA